MLNQIDDNFLLFWFKRHETKITDRTFGTFCILHDSSLGHVANTLNPPMTVLKRGRKAQK